jgi:hypothetical protein
MAGAIDVSAEHFVRLVLPAERFAFIFHFDWLNVWVEGGFSDNEVVLDSASEQQVS